jgi:hypothetical protein
MNEELQNLGYALGVIGFIVLLVFACSGQLRERAIEGAFANCEERYSDPDAITNCVARRLASEGYAD